MIIQSSFYNASLKNVKMDSKNSKFIAKNLHKEVMTRSRLHSMYNYIHTVKKWPDYKCNVQTF